MPTYKIWENNYLFCYLYLFSKIKIIFLTFLRNEMPATQRWYRPNKYIKSYSNLITELRQVNLKGEKTFYENIFTDLTLD